MIYTETAVPFEWHTSHLTLTSLKIRAFWFSFQVRNVFCSPDVSIVPVILCTDNNAWQESHQKNFCFCPGLGLTFLDKGRRLGSRVKVSCKGPSLTFLAVNPLNLWGNFLHWTCEEIWEVLVRLSICDGLRLKI